MGRMTLLLNILTSALWVAVLLDLVRHPLTRPAAWGIGSRRMLSMTLAVLALGAGFWGPHPLESRSEALARHPDAGQPVTEQRGEIRSPFAVYASVREIDGQGRTIRNERTTTAQVPLVLLAFLAYGFWSREGRRRLGASKTGAGGPVVRAGCFLMLAGPLLTACLGGTEGERAMALPAEYEARRPTRTIVPVRWDTLAHIRSTVMDTVLFSAGGVSADERGIWVADPSAPRIAHFDWSGNLLGYAGSRGQGPGEFLRPYQIDLDTAGNVWAHDLGNARIAAFTPERLPLPSVSLRALDITPYTFVVSGDGERILLVGATEKLQLRVIDRTGTVVVADSMDVVAPPSVWGMALQGEAARLRGDRDGNDAWAFAYGWGDGVMSMRGTTPVSGQHPVPEAVGFPAITRTETVDGNRSSTVTQLAGRPLGAASIWARDGEIFVLFRGTSEHAGRLLDRYDFETGRYLDSVIVPRSGRIAMWEERLVIVASNPLPEVLVLRAVR